MTLYHCWRDMHAGADVGPNMTENKWTNTDVQGQTQTTWTDIQQDCLDLNKSERSVFVREKRFFS